MGLVKQCTKASSGGSFGSRRNRMYFSSGKQIQVLFSLCLNRCILMLWFFRFVLPMRSLLSGELQQGSNLVPLWKNSNYTGKSYFTKLILYFGQWFKIQRTHYAKCASIQTCVILINWTRILGRSKLGRNSDGERESAPTRLLKKTSNEKEACRSRYSRNWIASKNQDTKSLTAPIGDAASFRVFLYRFWNWLLWCCQPRRGRNAEND